MAEQIIHKRRGRLPSIEVVDLFCGIGGLSYGISPDYEIFVSDEFFGEKLKDVDNSTKEYIRGCNSQKLIMPKRFIPNRDLLAMHFDVFKARHHI